MKSVRVQLAELIVKEAFGDGISDVAKFLMRRHKSPLRMIRFETRMSSKQVKLCLAIGIQHNFIIATQHKRGFNEYSVDMTAILHRLRYPSYVCRMKQLYGNTAEVLAEEILYNGQILHDALISKTITKLTRNGKEKISTSDVVEKLKVLISARFVEVCADVQDIKAEAGTSDQPPPSKRQKTDSDKAQTCYRTCTARFNYYDRDLQIVDGVTRKLGQKHGEVVRTMLRLLEVKSDPSASESGGLTSHEIYYALPKELAITSRGLLDVYLITLTDDEMGVVVKIGDSGGGSYVINYAGAMTSLCRASIEALVLERFGSKSLRCFRLLLMKQHLELKQLEDLAMIPPRDLKDLLYSMYNERFVAVTEIAKTADHAPSRTFYCFNVPTEQLARQLLEKNYKSILNLTTKRSQILSDNRRLLDKQQKVEAIIATLGNVEEDQKEEIEEMITPAERQQLKLVQQQTDRIENGELQLTSTTLVWEMYLEYRSAKRIAEAPRPKGAQR